MMDCMGMTGDYVLGQVAEAADRGLTTATIDDDVLQGGAGQDTLNGSAGQGTPVVWKTVVPTP